MSSEEIASEFEKLGFVEPEKVAAVLVEELLSLADLGELDDKLRVDLDDVLKAGNIKLGDRNKIRKWNRLDKTLQSAPAEEIDEEGTHFLLLQQN